MKNTVKINLYLLLTAFFYCACEKSLDLLPQTNYSESTFFETPDQFKLFATQFYSQLPDVNAASNRENYSDLLATFGGANNVSNGSYSPSPSSDLWLNAYSTIRNSTYLISKAASSGEPLKSQVAVYTGEARFFRAMAYFNLYKDFGGVPIIDKVLELSDEDLLYGPKNSRSEVVAYILADLDSAIHDLPEESSISGNDKGRVSKGAAQALKARVALFEGTWRKFRGEDGNALLDQAIQASNDLIAGNQYQLFDRRDVLGDTSYRYLFIMDRVKTNPAGLTKDAQNEFILVNKFDNTLRPSPVHDVHGSASPTQKLADMFLCKDGLPIEKSPQFMGRQTITSEYQNRDPRMICDLVPPMSRFWSSYPPEYNRNWGSPFTGGTIYDVNFGNTTNTGYLNHKFMPETAPPLSVDYPVIRLAEVLLINAEAKFERNGMISDADLDGSINKLRERVGLVKLTNALVSNNGLNMRTEIRRERTVELFMEGFRFDDLRRWKTAATEMPMALKGVQYTGTQYATDPPWSTIDFNLDTDGHIIEEGAASRSFGEKNYLFPLPTRQLLLNDKLEQNEGW